MTETGIVGNVEQQLGQVISKNVASLRKRADLSLDRLAERAGLSKGTVVGIENARANPSIGILCRLASALSVSVSDLMEIPNMDRTLSPIERTTPRQLWESAYGGKATLLSAISGEAMFELWSWTLGAGDCFTSDAHSPGTAELIAVQSGSLEVAVGSESLTLAAGETVKLRTDLPHSYKSLGPVPTSFTMAVLESGTTSPDENAASHR